MLVTVGFALLGVFTSSLAPSYFWGGGKYEVKKTDIEEFECLICEYEKPSGRETKVFFTFIDLAGNRPGMGILLDATKHEKVRFAVRAIESWYKREWLTHAQDASLGSKET